MPERSIICDTTVLLYLGRIGQSGLLPALFSTICVPEAVLLELDMGRVLRPDTFDPRSLSWVTLVSVSRAMVDDLPSNRLGTGERAVIAYAQARGGFPAGLDDLRARQLAESVGVKVIGTLGILLRAKQTGLIGTVAPLVEDVVNQGFRIGPDLYQAVLALAGEGP